MSKFFCWFILWSGSLGESGRGIAGLDGRRKSICVCWMIGKKWENLRVCSFDGVKAHTGVEGSDFGRGILDPFGGATGGLGGMWVLDDFGGERGTGGGGGGGPVEYPWGGDGACSGKGGDAKVNLRGGLRGSGRGGLCLCGGLEAGDSCVYEWVLLRGGNGGRTGTTGSGHGLRFLFVESSGKFLLRDLLDADFKRSPIQSPLLPHGK